MTEFNISEILKEPVGSKRSYTFEENGPIPALEGDYIHDLHGQVSLMRTDKGLLIDLALDTEVTCTCSRCLNSYDQGVSLRIEEEFFPSIDIKTGVGNDLDQADDRANVIDANHILDLTEPIRQQAIVSIPMKPLCRTDCAGICSNCGANLNESLCQCAEDVRNPKWGALLEILSRKNS